MCYAMTMVIWSCFCLYPMNYFIMTPKCVCFSDPRAIPLPGPLFSLFLLIMPLHRGMRAFPVSSGNYCTPLRYSPISTEPEKFRESLHIHAASPALAPTEYLMVGWMNKYTVGQVLKTGLQHPPAQPKPRRRKTLSRQILLLCASSAIQPQTDL